MKTFIVYDWIRITDRSGEAIKQSGRVLKRQRKQTLWPKT